jgi:hypothetical protein
MLGHITVPVYMFLASGFKFAVSYCFQVTCAPFMKRQLIYVMAYLI